MTASGGSKVGRIVWSFNTAAPDLIKSESEHIHIIYLFIYLFIYFYTEINATLNLLVRHNVNILASGGVGPDRFRSVTDSPGNHRPPKPRPVNLNRSLYNTYYNTRKR